MHSPSLAPSTSADTASYINTDSAMDAIDKRISGLKEKLAPDPYCDPAFREEYVTYLSPHTSSAVPRSLGLYNFKDESEHNHAALSGTSMNDIDEYYPGSGTDLEPLLPSQQPTSPPSSRVFSKSSLPDVNERNNAPDELRRASIGSSTGRQRHHGSEYEHTRERHRTHNRDHHDRQRDKDKEELHDQDKDKVHEHGREHRDRDRERHHRDHEREHHHRDHDHKPRDRDEDTHEERASSDKHSSDRHRRPSHRDHDQDPDRKDKERPRDHGHHRDSTSSTHGSHRSSKTHDRATESAKRADESTARQGKHDRDVKTVRSVDSDTGGNDSVITKAKEKGNKKKHAGTESRASLDVKPFKAEKATSMDVYPLTPLPEMLSPTLPPYFDSVDLDLSPGEVHKELELPGRMLSPTLPPIFDFDSDVSSGLGIRFDGTSKDKRPAKPPGRAAPINSVKETTAPLKKTVATKPATKPASRIVILRISPAKLSKQAAASKREAAESAAQGRANVKRPRTSQSTEPEVSLRATVKSLNDVSRKSSPNTVPKAIPSPIRTPQPSTLSASIAPSTPLKVTPAVKSPRPAVSSKENENEKPKATAKLSVSPLAIDNHNTITPPPSSLARDNSITPGTPTKKSTLAEYNKRRRNGASLESSFSQSLLAPELEKTMSATGSTPQRPSTVKRTISAGSLPGTLSTSSVPAPSLVPVANRSLQLLERKAQRWISLAMDRKHQSDRHKESGDARMASLYAMDALLAYLVGFDYEDKCAAIKNRLPSERNWSTLVPFGRHLINLHEVSKSPVLAGLCYHVRAVVYLRMAGFQQQAIKQLSHSSSSIAEQASQVAAESPETTASSFSGNGQSQPELADLLTKLAKNVDLAAYDFQRGARLLPIELIVSKYPDTWKKKTSAADFLSGTTPVSFGGSMNGPGLRPLEDKYVLPIQTFSGIREVAAFGAALLGEWAEQNNFRYESVLAKGGSE